MCEQIQELADESIRTRTELPRVVREHLESCADCSQYFALCSLISMSGRPPVQLPPTELSNRIASATFAKQGVWQRLIGKPAVWAPALGVLAATGWLVVIPRDVNQSARTAKPALSENGGIVVYSTPQVVSSVPAASRKSHHSAIALGIASKSVKSTSSRITPRDNVKFVAAVSIVGDTPTL
ncbi:MAG: hypothetical protein ACKO14_11790, partial [Armatimonadota bacterium]